MSKVIIRNRLDLDNPQAFPTIAWSVLTQAGAARTGNGQLSVRHDPVSGQMWYYGTPNSGIYSTAMYWASISGGTITFTLLSDSGGTSGCDFESYPASNPSGGYNSGDGSALQPWLGDRHPESQNAIDTLRGKLYQWSGLACNNAPAGDGIAYRDLWRVNLNADPTDNTLVKVTAATQGSTVNFGGSMTYVPAYDVLVLNGGGTTWVLAPTIGGSLDSNHMAAGCVDPDTWAQTYSGDNPTNPYFGILVNSAVTNRVLFFQTTSATTPWTVRVWAYHITEKTWTDLNAMNQPSNSGQFAGETPIALATSGDWANSVFYHRTCHGSAGGCGSVRDFLYDPVVNVWTPLNSTGTGPQTLAYMGFAPNVGTHGSLIAYENGNIWWKGELQ